MSAPVTQSRAVSDNAAWQLVVEAEDGQLPTPCHMIGRTIGVSLDRVLAMVGRYSAMKRAGIEPTGDWWHDRVNVKLPLCLPPEDGHSPATTINPTIPAAI